jgi:hypothetical protein
MQETMQLTLDLSEVNQILGALGRLPYEDVFQLIDKIQRQARAQIQEENVRVAEPRDSVASAS